MSTFRLIREVRTLDRGYIADVKLIDGASPHTFSFAEGITCNNTNYEMPIQVIELSEKDKKYRLFIDIATIPAEKRVNLLEQIKSQIINLTLVESANIKLLPNSKKMIFVIDESVLFENLPIINIYSINDVESIIYIKTEKQTEDLINYFQDILQIRINLLTTIESKTVRTLLSGHKMGTYSFISGSWSMVDHIKKIAYTVGFSDEEIQINGFGEKNENVYCVKCYSYNKKQTTDVIKCEHCETELDVSTHYSKRLDAYLGYIHLA